MIHMPEFAISAWRSILSWIKGLFRNDGIVPPQLAKPDEPLPKILRSNRIVRKGKRKSGRIDWFYRVRNDIIKTDDMGSPTWTDEPLWLRNEIDTWDKGQGGGRFFADEDARYSYIISHKPLSSPVGDDLVELTEEQILLVIDKAFPPGRIVREGEPDELIPSPSVDVVCSTWWGYATNHTGTISASESWTVANNDHHITGNITLSANVVLTWDAGINVYYDGAYSITYTAGSGGTTSLIATGTSSLPIAVESNSSRTNTATSSSVTTGVTAANNSSTVFQYCSISNFSTFLVVSGFTSLSTTIDHVSVRDCLTFIQNNNASTIAEVTISNSRFSRIYTQIELLSTAISGTGGTQTFNDCEFAASVSACINSTAALSGGTISIAFTDCWFQKKSAISSATAVAAVSAITMTRCLHEFDSSSIGVGASTNISYSNSIITKGNSNSGSINHAAAATTNNSLTNCDIMIAATSAGYLISNASTAATTITLTSCYLSGGRGADIFNYYTGVETPAQTNTSASGTITFTTPRTTRNFGFIPASISSSSVTATSATVSWINDFRSPVRLRVGTTSGIYTDIYTKVESWSNYDGKGQFGTSHSFSFTRLKPGTTYYYVADTWDPVMVRWQSSTENSLTTLTRTPIAYAGF